MEGLCEEGACTGGEQSRARARKANKQETDAREPEDRTKRIIKICQARSPRTRPVWQRPRARRVDIALSGGECTKTVSDDEADLPVMLGNDAPEVRGRRGLMLRIERNVEGRRGIVVPEARGRQGCKSLGLEEEIVWDVKEIHRSRRDGEVGGCLGDERWARRQQRRWCV